MTSNRAKSNPKLRLKAKRAAAEDKYEPRHFTARLHSLLVFAQSRTFAMHTDSICG